MIKKGFLLPLLLFFLHTASAQEWKAFDFKNGDFLFQDMDCGALCDAIEKVTPGIAGKHFSHVGLVYRKGTEAFVIEALGSQVQLTSLDHFILRQKDRAGHPKIVVGRLKPAFDSLHQSAIAFALKQIGVPYDEDFIYNNGKYYCSELLYDAYLTANGGSAFFELSPMTFADPETGKRMPVWDEYYRKAGRAVPEGEPGCNPGSLATSPHMEIVASFYE